MRTSVDKPSILFTVDVEDWVQSTWDHSAPIGANAGLYTERLLDLFAAHKIHAVMFVLGLFAMRFPNLVRRMVQEGHEIASHGWGHIQIFYQSPDLFRKDVSRSKEFLQDLCGVQVLGYRAPDFSIIESTLWALDILSELGFRYDSSIFPIEGSRYGIPSWPASPVQVQCALGNSLIELPPATIRAFGRRWPMSGGGYHRLLPSRAIDFLVRAAGAEQNPVVCYCHPYEIAPDEFSMSGLEIPWKTRLNQGLGRRSFQAKLELLMCNFRCATLEDALLPTPPEFQPAALRKNNVSANA
jgi:polysaccharide deacetylase family protein (PEP-CTERM system associated)